MNSWASLAPKAPDLAPKMGAFNEARRDAMKTESDALDLQKKKILPQLFASAVVAEPDGKGGIVHRFDNDRFMEGIAKAGPAAQSAYDSYTKDVFPQVGAETVGRATAANVTPEGGVSLSGMGKAAKESGAYAPGVLAAARAQAKEAASTGREVAGNLAGLEVLGADNSAGKTLQGLEEVAPSMLGGGGPRKLPDLKPEDIKDRARASEGLRSLGIAHDATPAGMAAAIKTAEDIEFRAQLADALTGKPEEWPARVAAVRGKEDAIRSGVRAKILSTGLQVGGEKLSQKGAAQSQAQSSKEFGIKMDPVDAAHKEGFVGVTPANIDKFTELRGAKTWLENTSHALGEAARKPNLEPDDFGAALQVFQQAPKAAEGISTISASEEFGKLFRPESSLGRLAAESHGLLDFTRNLGRAEVSADDQKKILRRLQGVIDEQLKTGKTVSDLNAYRKWSSAKPSKEMRPGGKTEPAKTAPKASSKPINLDEF